MITTLRPSLGRLDDVLVAIEDAASGERVLRFAIALALRHGADLSLVTAIDRVAILANASADGGGYALGAAVFEEFEAMAMSTLSLMKRRAANAGVAATTGLLDGRPAAAIVARAKDGIDAIVVGTRAMHGLARFFQGSTADGVIRHAGVPTFVIPPAAREAEPLARVFVALDESEASESASRFAIGLAATERANLTYCSVVDTRDLLAKAANYGYDPTTILLELRAAAGTLIASHMAAARSRALAVAIVLVDGDPATELLAVAEYAGADVIVVGTHGRRGVRRLFLGSVAESIVSRSTVPVLVVRTQSPDPRGRAAKATVALAASG